MRDEQISQIPVLIVGAGPAGLMTAVALARHGVDCLLVERRRTLSALPRATTISLRTMELLRSWGLEAELRAGGVDVEWTQWFCDDARAGGLRPRAADGHPDRRAERRDQPDRAGLRAAGSSRARAAASSALAAGGRVELGTEVAAIDARRDGVRAVLRDVAGNGERTVEARYLVAADGAHSSVRAALGIRDAGARPPAGSRQRALPRAAVGARRRPPLRPVRDHAPSRRGRSTARRSGRSLALRGADRARCRPARDRVHGAGARAAHSDRGRRPHAATADRANRQLHVRRPARRAASARAARSSSATPRTVRRRAAARG